MNIVSNETYYNVGLTGNHYVYSTNKENVTKVASLIDKSIFSIYFNKTYSVWAIRVKNKAQKEKLREIFKKNINDII